MKLNSLFIIALIVSFFTIFTSCEDETTGIGSSLVAGEVDITIDTISYELNGKAIAIENFDSKTGNLMIGSIQSKNYGSLACSFVTRLMCSANLGVPDSLFTSERVDSCKLILGAQRNEIIGDSLAPQQLTVYKLIKQLPSDINNQFDPAGYYDPQAPFASKNYTVSEIASTDSAFYNNSFVDISLNLPLEFGKQIFEAYKNTPSMFEWPQNMAKEFLPGFFVKPTFGNGCVANINSLFVAVYYHSLNTVMDKDSTFKVEHVSHMAVPFTVSPEVLSSNNINFKPSQFIADKNSGNASDGEVVITTPGGYIGEFKFPAEDLIKRYKEKDTHLSTVNDLYLYIPAETFDTSAGIGMANNIILILKDEYDTFFQENKIPDNRTSFTGTYDANKGRYTFSSMRTFFLNLLKKEKIEDSDITFMMVPAEIQTETSSNYYSESTYVVKCTPLTSKPTMTLLKTNEAQVTFSFSTQYIK